MCKLKKIVGKCLENFERMAPYCILVSENVTSQKVTCYSRTFPKKKR